MTRRLQGGHSDEAVIVVGTIAALAVAGGLVYAVASAGPDPQPPPALTYCVTTPPPPAAGVVVDDAHCDRGERGFGLIEYQVPRDPNPDDDVDVDVMILGIGQSVPYDARARSYGSGFRPLPRGTQPSVGSAPARAVRPPTAVAGRSSTITRGGLGVASSSSSAGKGGSSGS